MKGQRQAKWKPTIAWGLRELLKGWSISAIMLDWRGFSVGLGGRILNRIAAVEVAISVGVYIDSVIDID